MASKPEDYPQHCVIFYINYLFGHIEGSESRKIEIEVITYQLNKKPYTQDKFRVFPATILRKKSKYEIEESVSIYIRKSILPLFPKCLGFRQSYWIWDQELSGEELIKRVTENLEKVLSFADDIRDMYVDMKKCPFVLSKNLPSHFTEKLITCKSTWCFANMIKKTEFSLQRLICDKYAKSWMKKILKEFAGKKMDYFEFEYRDFYEEEKLMFDEMNFFNIIMLMNPDIIPKFNEKFLIELKKFQELGVPHLILRELRSYLSGPKDIFYIHEE